MSYELIGIETVNDKDYYVLKLNDGVTESYDYFDVTTFLKSKTISIRKEEDQSIETTLTYSDYKEINGILFPHAMSLNVGQMNFSGKVTSITVNGKADLKEYK